MNFNVKIKEERLIGVYKIRNIINNKTYVGSTSTNFRHRYLQYKSGFKRKLDNQPVLYRAFRKYGFDNFEFTILKICKKEECLKIEQIYINKGTDYNTCLVAGSLQGLIHSNNAKTRTVIKGKHHCAVKVNMYSLSGDFIKPFNSLIEAKEFANIKSSSNISECCKGNLFSSGGYRWSYKGEELFNRIDKRTLPATKEKLLKISKPRKIKLLTKKS